MSSESSTGSVFFRFRLMAWLGAFFCFVLVPALLINEGLGSMLQLRSDKEQRRIFKEMDDRLSFLTRHADEQHYYHSLLKKSFQKATASSDPLQSIKASIALLKKRFPDALRFIVWNDKGQVVNELTDEKSYRYIIANLYGFFSEIAGHCRSNYPGEPETLQIVEKRINIFRSYLGRFLVPQHLRLPFQAGEHGKCILADSPDAFPLFWFDSHQALTVLCSIKSSLFDNPGVRHAVETLNTGVSNIRTGFIDMRNLKVSLDTIRDEEQRQIIIELGKYENAGLAHRQTADYLMAFKLLSPDLRGFCVIHRRDMAIGYPEQLKHGILARLLAALGIGLSIFGVYSLRLPRLSISIRTRMALLFLYANGLPLMMLGTIGHEYLQQREDALFSEAHARNERILQEIDSGYRRHKRALNQRTAAALKDFIADVTDRMPDRNDLETLKRVVHTLDAEEMTIYGEDGNTLVGYKRNRRLAGQTFMRMFATSAISFANQVEETADKAKGSHSQLALTGNTIVNDHSSLLENLLNTLDSVELYNFGTEMKLCYASLLGNKKLRRFHSAMVITWRHEEAQAIYAAGQVNLSNIGAAATSYAAMAASTGQVFARQQNSTEKLRPVMQKALNLQSAHENFMNIDGQACLITAIAGRQMDSISLAAITPTAWIADDLQQAWHQMLALAILSMLIISAVVVALSKQFLGPVRQLAEAVRQIGQRNFSYRTSIDSPDEFGELGKVFNLTMEGMAELEIGRVVQEALLPDSGYRNGRISIYARTATMTKLGGDYFDYLKLSENQTGVFMGDVAGHGIPAALIMAMAKATVLVNQPLLTNPAGLLSALHDMLFKLKSDNFKRMMTCQYLVFNDQTGEVLIANAGHCFPVVVGPHGCSSRLIEIVGTPVGIARKARYQNHSVSMQPGETMILYSDGLIEATSASGEVFGPDLLLEQVKSVWSNDLQQYYQNLFQANRSWVASVDDDLTIVLIRFDKEPDHD
ncbi:MAG TPA: SpoIIE family protein phosphatase [Candidatus Rifleibacterium sp.]|nr:SpoIIE family protein phosphatase [Candidatus Rifleibacterium sp.]